MYFIWLVLLVNLVITSAFATSVHTNTKINSLQRSKKSNNKHQSTTKLNALPSLSSLSSTAISAAPVTTKIIATAASTSLISKVLGYCMGFGSLFLYSPILIDLFKSSSADGYALETFLTTMLGSSSTILYSAKKGFPIDTYIELCNNALQQLIIVGMICVYDNKLNFLIGLGLTLITAAFLLITRVSADGPILAGIQLGGTLLQNFSLVPQIINNYKRKNTRWSIYTALASFLGLCVRIFTTASTVKDRLLLCSYCTSASLNAVLIEQIIISAKSKIKSD